MILEAVSGILESLGASYALIGGQAVAMRGHPRLTVDYDFLTSDRRVFDPDVWKSLEDRGGKIDIRKGDFDDPLAGVVHITFDEDHDADVVVAKWRWEQAIIERAERLVIQGIAIPVPRTSDLILLKLAAGGYLDRQDVYSLVHVGNRDQLIREVEEQIGALPPEARESWQGILSSN